MQKIHIANSDKPVVFYSLDIILAVGYKINPKTAIEFRKWATKVLREHITKDYTINRKQIGRNIQPSTLTVLTLLIAESKPEKKDQVVALVTQLLK